MEGRQVDGVTLSGHLTVNGVIQQEVAATVGAGVSFPLGCGRFLVLKLTMEFRSLVHLVLDPPHTRTLSALGPRQYQAKHGTRVCFMGSSAACSFAFADAGPVPEDRKRGKPGSEEKEAS
jgi:hypothetical protein